MDIFKITETKSQQQLTFQPHYTKRKSGKKSKNPNKLTKYTKPYLIKTVEQEHNLTSLK